MIARQKIAGELFIFPPAPFFVRFFRTLTNTLFSLHPHSHRIGQTKPVSIIKMVTGGTVDEDIYKIQESKMKMNDAIMEKDKKQNKSENAEMSRLANAAVERFLKSPSRPSSESS